LNNVGIDDIGQVIDQQVLTAFAVVLSETQTVPGAYDGPGIDGIGCAEARCEVELRHIDQRAIVDRAVAGFNERLRGGVVVGKQIVRFPLWGHEFITKTGIDGEL
jgi:hypothetical protein